jgi:putative ABC transport system ATP-binding protein
MLEFRDVTVRRGGRVILDRASLTVAPGEHLVLTGPSGSGKSTLLKAALLFEPVDEGEVLWDGRRVTADDLAAHRARFLYIGQKPLPFTFAANRARRPDRALQAGLMEAMGLDPALRENPYSRLSGGEQQRLTIIQGLQLERSFCLLDEVTSSLDQQSLEAVVGFFARDTARTVLAVTHNRQWIDFGFAEVTLESGKLGRRS